MTTPPGPLGPDQQQAIVDRVGRGLAGLVPPGWRQLRVDYRAAGRHVECDVHVTSADGAVRPVPPPRELLTDLAELRTGMYRPGIGTWLTAVLTFDPVRGAHTEYSDDPEPAWRRLPPPIGFQDELRFFPRADHHVPTWLRARAGLPPLRTPGPAAPPPGSVPPATPPPPPQTDGPTPPGPPPVPVADRPAPTGPIGSEQAPQPERATPPTPAAGSGPAASGPAFAPAGATPVGPEGSTGTPLAADPGAPGPTGDEDAQPGPAAPSSADASATPLPATTQGPEEDLQPTARPAPGAAEAPAPDGATPPTSAETPAEREGVADPPARTAADVKTPRIYDGLDEAGRPVVEREPLSPGEREQVLAYLEAAPAVLASRSYGADAFAPERVDVVPMVFRTDGSWAWPAAVAYYLREHDVAPDPELLGHIRGHRFAVPEVDKAAQDIALAAITGRP